LCGGGVGAEPEADSDGLRPIFDAMVRLWAMSLGLAPPVRPRPMVVCRLMCRRAGECQQAADRQNGRLADWVRTAALRQQSGPLGNDLRVGIELCLLRDGS
jgi:hypothetical protein